MYIDIIKNGRTVSYDSADDSDSIQRFIEKNFLTKESH